MRNIWKILVGTGLFLSIVLSGTYLMAQHMRGHGKMHSWMHGDKELLFGAPGDSSKLWNIAKGGQIYDKWWVALDKPEPQDTHPAYPKSGKKNGPGTWRCKECHGWDYKGKDGKYATGSHATGIKGIREAAGRKPEEIAKLLRSALHGYTASMIGDADLMRLALFVSQGQHDTDKFIDAKSGEVAVAGSDSAKTLEHGKGLYQTTCAVCHGFDGRRLDFGSRKKASYIGTEAKKNPWEVLHKIRNSHPGVEMISLNALPVEDTAALLAYMRTLPTK